MTALVEGRKGGGKGGGGHTPTEATDTLRSLQVAEVLDLVSEGPIQGLVNGLKSVYLDGVPLQNADGTSNFDDVGFAWTLGTQGQGALHGFDLVQNEVGVALKVTQISPIVRTVLSGSDAVRVTVGVPQLSFQDPNNGDVVGNKVEYAIDLQSNGGGFVEVYHTTMDGKTMSHYQRATVVKLTGAGPWDIRVRRITADSTKSNSINAIYWDSYTEIQSAKLRYPNSAVHGLRVNAQHFGRVPVRGYDILGRVLQVPSNYNPITRAYVGTWDGTFVPAWSNNPAWVFYDLLTHPRYGLGQFVQVAHINKWRLYQVAQYCDELVPDGHGGSEPRFTCNLYLQTQNDAYRTLQDLVAIFRGILLYGNGVVDVVQDAPSDALSLFTPANVIDGKFVYQGASERTRHSGVIVYWNNLANQGKREPELYQEPDLVARFGVRNLELSPLGTWSRGQAVRLAKWALYSEDSEGEVVSFGVGSEGALVPLGRVFKIADPSVSGLRLGGRVKSATANDVTLDKAVTLTPGEAYTLTVALPDAGDPFNLVSEMRTVLSAQDSGNRLVLNAPYSSLPAAHAIWLLESTAVAATTWRCIGVREVPGEMRFEITAVSHDPTKYALIEQGIRLVRKPISVLQPGAVMPTNLVISEAVYTAGGAAKSRLTISWTAGAPGQYYRVSWRYRSGVWNVMPDTSAQNVEIADVMPGMVDIAVRSINGLGSVSRPLEGSYDVGGKTTTGAVAALELVVTSTGVQAQWAAPAAADGATWAETELRRGETFAAGALVFKGRALSYNMGWLTAQNLLVWAVHRDSSGTTSQPISASMFINPPAEPVVTGNVDLTVLKLAWQDCKTTQPIAHYILKRGSTWIDAQPIGNVSALMATLLEINEGRHKFWCAAVDLGGNTGSPGSALIDVGSPISAVLAILNAGLTDAVADINTLGTSLATSNAHITEITDKIDSPTLGLQAQKGSTDMLALALQQSQEAVSALDLTQLLMLNKTDKTIRDAGIVVDPVTGSVHIVGVEQTATSLTQVKADFDAMTATVLLQAQRITQLNTDLVNAQLDPTGAAVVAGVITQINDVKATLDAVNATLVLKASSATVADNYLVLQQTVQTLSQHGSDLLVIAQTINALQNDMSAASSRIVVLEHSAEAATELVAARLGDQAKGEIQDAATLAALLTGEAGKQDVVKQLAYAKTQLQASVDTLGQSTAQSITTLTATVGANRADYESKAALLTTADATEAAARQTLALKQQNDHNTVTAAVQTESAARTTADTAEASARQTLEAKQQTDTNTLTAAVQAEATVRATADSTEASTRQTLALKQQNDHTTVTAAVQTESTARIAADAAEVSARETLALKQQTDANTLTAAVQAESTARIAADAAEVSARQTLAVKQQTDHNTVSASVQTESSARVTGDQAQASMLTQVQASLNGTIAGLAQRLAVVVDANGNVVASYTLALNANGRVVGVRIDNNGTVGNFVVQADKFAFVLPGQNGEIPLFVAGVVAGQNTFGVNGNLMVDGSVYARSLNVTRLSALTAKLGTMTAGQLSLDSDDGNPSYVRSGQKWWLDGVAGWVFAKEANATFMDITTGPCSLRMHSNGYAALVFPGISITNNGVTLSQPNVVGTTQLQTNSVTIPWSMAGSGGFWMYDGVQNTVLGSLSIYVPQAIMMCAVATYNGAVYSGNGTGMSFRVFVDSMYGGTICYSEITLRAYAQTSGSAQGMLALAAGYHTLYVSVSNLGGADFLMATWGTTVLGVMK